MANSLNSIAMTGFIQSEVEYRTFTSGLEAAFFDLRFYSRGKVDGEWKSKANYIRCKLFKPNPGLKPYLVPGKAIGVTGSLQIDSWDDKNTHHKRTAPVIVVNDVSFVGGDRKEDGTAAGVFDSDKAPGVPLDQADDTPF